MRGNRILVVEDNPDHRDLATRALEQRFPDLELVPVGTRSEYDGAMNHGPYDLIITDYQLKWSTGLDVLRESKQLWPDQPVLLVTAFGSESLAAEGLEAGLDGYLTKWRGFPGDLAERAARLLQRQIETEEPPDAAGQMVQFLASVHDVLYRFNPEERKYEFLSPSFTDLTGYEVEEMLQDPVGIQELLDHPVDAPVVRRMFREYRKRGGQAEPMSLDYRICCKDGRIQWVNETISFEFDPQDRLLYTNGVIRKLSPTKQQEIVQKTPPDSPDRSPSIRDPELKANLGQLLSVIEEFSRTTVSALRMSRTPRPDLEQAARQITKLAQRILGQKSRKPGSRTTDKTRRPPPPGPTRIV